MKTASSVILVALLLSSCTTSSPKTPCGPGCFNQESDMAKNERERQERSHTDLIDQEYQNDFVLGTNSDDFCEHYTYNQIFARMFTNCNKGFIYRVKTTVLCPLDINPNAGFPLRGRTIYWELNGKKGETKSNLDGAILLTFFSDQELKVESVLKLSTDPKFKNIVENKSRIMLSKEQCAPQKTDVNADASNQIPK